MGARSGDEIANEGAGLGQHRLPQLRRIAQGGILLRRGKVDRAQELGVEVEQHVPGPGIGQQPAGLPLELVGRL